MWTRRSSGHAWLSILVASVMLLLGAVVTGCSRSSSEVWADMQEELGDARVNSVELWAHGGEREVLVGEDAETFSQAFLAGVFDEDNSQHFGPTADLGLLLSYEGLETITVTQWPDDRFELSHDGAQFLISSPELTRLLRSRGFEHEEYPF